MIETFRHRVGEKFSLISNVPNATALVIRKSSDGKIYNKVTKLFDVPVTDLSIYAIPLLPHVGISGLQQLNIDFLPATATDLIFQYVDSSFITLSSERHIYGAYYELTSPSLCIVYGTVINPSGTPVANAKVEAFLNRGGYFIDKTPLLGPTTNAVTDDSGYFELPLLQGIEVTINISHISFTTSGYVPLVNSVALSPYCLLKSTSKKSSLVK